MHADEAILASEYDGTPEIEQRSLTQKPFVEKIRNHVYLTLLFIGIGLLWPWNCILSASVYFKHDVFHDKTIWANILPAQ